MWKMFSLAKMHVEDGEYFTMYKRFIFGGFKEELERGSGIEKC